VARQRQQPRKAAAPAQKSLLDRQGDLPSPKLTETIRQRETSGSGWVSAAFLMMLLSGNDLSASDRSWVERRLEEAEAEEGGRAVNERTADVPAQVAFRYTGDQELTAGIAVALEIEASSSGKTLVTSCAVGDPLSGGAKSNNGLLRWTPPAEGAHVVTCEAADVIDYRLLYVAPARSIARLLSSTRPAVASKRTPDVAFYNGRAGICVSWSACTSP
jgi:hypothetical protein